MGPSPAGQIADEGVMGSIHATRMQTDHFIDGATQPIVPSMFRLASVDSSASVLFYQIHALGTTACGMATRTRGRVRLV